MSTAIFTESQPVVVTQLLRSLKHGRLAHAYLFEGDRGTGKHEMALWLAQALFCLTPQNDGQPCGSCNNCQRIAAGEHPDVQVIAPEGQTIKVEQIRSLQAEFAKSGFESQQKVFILQDAEKMNASAANSLLKFLEEPAGQFLAVLETGSLGRILPTIQSRCQVLHFQPLSAAQLQEQLQAEGIGKETAGLLTALTNSFDKAVEISQEEWFNEARDSVQQWFAYLKARDPQAVIYIQKKLVKVFKEKELQFSGLTMLLYFYQQFLRETLESGSAAVQPANTGLQFILEAEQKLAANVSFQNVTEQLAIRIIGLKN